jgi:transcriptional regulator with XRE-family HTH domain
VKKWHETNIMKVKIKEVLERELQSNNITVNRLAKELGIPVSVLHGWRHGRLPSGRNIHYLYKVAEYFHISVSALLFNKREEISTNTILFNSEFADGNHRYKLCVEKINKNEN